MSKKEGSRILDTQDAATTGENIGDKEARQLPQTAGRRKLSDISNLPHNQRPLIGEKKSQIFYATLREFIDRLQKENMTLVKMLAQRDKIIEQSGVEFNRLSVNFVKMQEQNRQLALANTQMLAELNLGKERLNVLEHELSWKSGLLKAREMGNERKSPCKNADAEEEMDLQYFEEGELSKEGGDDDKHCKTNQSLQSDSLDISDRLQSVQNIENRRRSTRRQSTLYKVAELKRADNHFKMDDTKIPSYPLPEHSPEKGFHTENDASVKNECNDSASEQRCESQEPSRFSRCRPAREAARKVISYNEQPINIKMRRSE